MSQSFDQWLNEIEVFSTRRERALQYLGPNYEKWLLAAWIGGMSCDDPVIPSNDTMERDR